MMPEYKIYGPLLFQLKPDKPRQPEREIHTLQSQWQVPTSNYFKGRDPHPNYPNMRIITVSEEEEIGGMAYVQDLDCEGILGDQAYLELDRSTTRAEEGWDQMDLRIFTREPDDPRWVKGSRYQADNLTGVIGTASTDKLNKTAHGMATGQLFKIVFASGFTGLTTTGQYYAIKIDDDNIKAATSLANALAGTAINITADGTGATITPYVVGYENMYITDRSDRVHRAKDYYELTLTLKGILGTKPYKRRINGAVTTSNAIFPDGAVLSNDTYINYPPAALGTATMGADPGNTIEYSAATLSLVDSWVQVGPPPTDYIGAFWTPPDAPDVVTASLPGGGDLKYFFPWGWHCTSMPCEQLPGLDLWLVSATFNYQVPYIPQST